MCKLAILSPDRVSDDEMTEVAMDLYRSQRSGLGIVAVHEEEDKFEYDVEKWVEPNIDEVAAFIVSNSDYASWFILHGRLATSGGRADNEATHPIEVDCPECEVDYVLHNGVYQHSSINDEKAAMEQNGHEFTTFVDSELMAHRIGTVPSSIAESDELLDKAIAGYEQGIILLNEDRIFLYSNRKYRIDENGEMYVSYESYANEDAEHNYSTMIISASEEE